MVEETLRSGGNNDNDDVAGSDTLPPLVRNEHLDGENSDVLDPAATDDYITAIDQGWMDFGGSFMMLPFDMQDGSGFMNHF